MERKYISIKDIQKEYLPSHGIAIASMGFLNKWCHALFSHFFYLICHKAIFCNLNIYSQFFAITQNV